MAKNWNIKSITPVGTTSDYGFPEGFAPVAGGAPASAALPTGFSGALAGSPYGASSAGRQIAERGYYDFGPRQQMGSMGGGGGYTIGGGGGREDPMVRLRREHMQRQATQQGMAGLRGLVGSYNVAYQEARRANEQRYQQLLDISSQTTGQREADIRASYAGQGADIRQQLARQGMAGTTVAPTMQMGVQREQQSSLNRLADMMQQTRMGVIERREDRYPEMGAITSLAGMLGQGGGAGGIGNILGALSGLRM